MRLRRKPLGVLASFEGLIFSGFLGLEQLLIKPRNKMFPRLESDKVHCLLRWYSVSNALPDDVDVKLKTNQANVIRPKVLVLFQHTTCYIRRDGLHVHLLFFAPVQRLLQALIRTVYLI